MITKEQADEIVSKYPSFYKKDIIVEGEEVSLYDCLLSNYDAFQEEALTRISNGWLLSEDERIAQEPMLNAMTEILYDKEKEDEIYELIE